MKIPKKYLPKMAQKANPAGKICLINKKLLRLTGVAETNHHGSKSMILT
jgi:hypothetical protein